MKKKILSILMCTVMASAFVMPISAEGGIELYGVVLRCPKCASGCDTHTETSTSDPYYNNKCTHGYNNGRDLCQETTKTTYTDCSNCGYSTSFTSTNITVLICGGYN